MKNIFGLGSSNNKNYNNNDIYSYLQKSEVTHTYYINQTPKGVPDNAENLPALELHVEIRDNYKHQE